VQSEGRFPPSAYAVNSAMIAMLSRWSAAQRARSRDNSATKNSARVNAAHAAVACCTFFRRLYHVEREMPSASQGRCARRLGPMPCALRHFSERKRASSRRSSSVCFVRCKQSPPYWSYAPKGGRTSVASPCLAPEPEVESAFQKKFSF
jgi:hypothetical protein